MKPIVASVLMTLIFAIVCPGTDVVANCRGGERRQNLRVLSVEGGAAVQNLKDVHYLRNIDMGLTTLEAMNYIDTSGGLGNVGVCFV